MDLKNIGFGLSVEMARQCLENDCDEAEPFTPLGTETPNYGPVIYQRGKFLRDLDRICPSESQKQAVLNRCEALRTRPFSGFYCPDIAPDCFMVDHDGLEIFYHVTGMEADSILLLFLNHPPTSD